MRAFAFYDTTTNTYQNPTLLVAAHEARNKCPATPAARPPYRSGTLFDEKPRDGEKKAGRGEIFPLSRTTRFALRYLSRRLPSDLARYIDDRLAAYPLPIYRDISRTATNRERVRVSSTPGARYVLACARRTEARPLLSRRESIIDYRLRAISTGKSRRKSRATTFVSIVPRIDSTCHSARRSLSIRIT